MLQSSYVFIVSIFSLLLFNITSNKLTVAASVGISEVSTYFLGLRKIYTSDGFLKPAFHPQIEAYSILLPHACSSIVVIPEIDYSRPEYQMGRLTPVVTILWKSERSFEQHTAQRRVELPENGEPFSVKIKVANPKNSLDFKVYTLTIIQLKPYLLVGLKNLEVVDDQKNYPRLSQIISLDTYLYDIFINPGISYFKLKPRCVFGNTVTVNRNLISSESWISIPRETDHYRQIVEIQCSSSQAHKNYIFSVITSRQSSGIPNPVVATASSGFMCSYHDTYYDCPNPKFKNSNTQLVIEGPLNVQYTVESSDKSVQLLGFSDIQTIPFEYTTIGKIKLVAHAGVNTTSWDINFVETRLQEGVIRICSLILGIILMLLLASFIFVIGFLSLSGLGIPTGIPEATTTLVLSVQFVCFVTSIKGIEDNVLAEISDSIKWVTFFWPPPGSIHFSSVSSWGDPNNIRNAYGCLFWTSLLHVFTSLIHGILLFREKRYEMIHTIPYSMKFGNWEQRLLHSTCFPMCVAASMILLNSNTTFNWKLYSYFILVSFPAWLYFVCKTMYESIKREDVQWIWDKPHGDVEQGFNTSGYWSDVYCDQLVTVTAERSFITENIYPFQWATAIATVDQIVMDARDANVYIPVFSLRDFFFLRFIQDDFSHDESNEPFAEIVLNFKVHQTVRPKRIFRGRRIFVGWVVTNWLMVFMTYEAIVKSIESIRKNPPIKDKTIQIQAHTSQVTGPFANGAFCFFYDGARLPSIRIVDGIYRFMLGALVGMALVNAEYPNLCIFSWISIAVISELYVMYQFFFNAYTRRAEKWAIEILTIGILFLSIVSILFKFQEIYVSGPNFLIHVLLGLSCCSVLYLTVYGALVLILTCSAIAYPLEEAQSLESVNCNVIISRVSDCEQWVTNVPGWCQEPILSLKVQWTIVDNEQFQVSILQSEEKPMIPLNLVDLLFVNRWYSSDGLIDPAILYLLVPDSNDITGYRYITIYNIKFAFAETCRFLKRDPRLVAVAESIARNITLELKSILQMYDAVISVIVDLKEKKPNKKEDYIVNYQPTIRNKSRRKHIEFDFRCYDY